MSMFNKSRIKKDFSDAAARYDAHAVLQQKVLKNLLERAKPLLPLQGNVLDVGCGTGQLAPLLKEYKVTAIDLAYLMCERAVLRGAVAINANMESLPFADGSFDVVFSSLALQWVEYWQQAIGEMERVLKPDGVLAISTFGEGTLQELKKSFKAVDNDPHVSDFISGSTFEYSETVIEYFPDLAALMSRLKALGARNKLSKGGKALMTPKQLKVVEEYYHKHFAQENGLPVTWKVLYSVKKTKR